MRLTLLTLAVLVAVNSLQLTQIQCKRKQRFWRKRCLPNGWKTDIESCKAEMAENSPMTKRRNKKCTRLESEMKTSGQDYCWPVDCSEELVPTDEPVEPTEPRPSPEELCQIAQTTFETKKCGDVLCDASKSDEECNAALDKLTSDCSFAFDCPPTPEELCKDAMNVFTGRDCGTVICSDKTDTQCSDALFKLTSDCNFAFDCPKPNPESGKLADDSLLNKMKNEPECRKVCAGQTSGSGWKQYLGRDGQKINGAYIDVDTSACGFVYERKYPDILTSITSPEHNRQMYNLGGSAFYKTDNDKIFRVYLRLNPEDKKDKDLPGISQETKPTDTFIMVREKKWIVEWIAAGFIC